MKKGLMFSLLLISMLIMTACGQKQQQDKKVEKVIKIGAIPDQNISVLNRRFGGVAKYVEKQTGIKIEYVPTVDYSALVTAFERGEINLVWFGGLTSVQAINLVPDAKVIAQRSIDSKFKSVFIERKGIDLKNLSDIKGHTFTFGSESSTSGHLMPRYFMTKSGINLDTDLDGIANYSGSHDKTWKLVEAGAFDVGALNISVWQRALRDKKVDLTKVKVFYTTPPYFDYNWTIRGDVDKIYGEGTTKKIQDALLSYGKDNPKDMQELFGDTKFVKSENKNYSAIRTVAKQLKIIK